MSQIRDIELETAYSANAHLDFCIGVNKQTDVVQKSNFIFATLIGHDQDLAIEINSKMVVIAKYDQNQFSSPPDMVAIGIFSSTRKAKDTVKSLLAGDSLGDEMLKGCEYKWAMIDEVIL